nr:uncharacterized protein LOC112211390 [Halyomorpha halys]
MNSHKSLLEEGHRARSNENTPNSETDRKAKRTKISSEKPEGQMVGEEVVPPTMSYRKAMEGIKVGIFSENYPEDGFSEEQFNSVQLEITNLSLNGEPCKCPKFHGTNWNHGWLQLTCVNQATVEWVMENTPRLRPWEGAKLKALKEEDLPRKKPVIVYLPLVKYTEEEILKIIHNQNPDLKVNTWRVFKREDNPTGTQIVVGVEKEQLKALTEQGTIYFA